MLDGDDEDGADVLSRLVHCLGKVECERESFWVRARRVRKITDVGWATEDEAGSPKRLRIKILDEACVYVYLNFRPQELRSRGKGGMDQV